MSPALDPTAKIVTPRQATLDLIRAEASRFGVTVREVLSDDRTGRVVVARHYAIRRVAAERPHFTLPQIGQLFGRDHSTVMYVLGRKAR